MTLNLSQQYANDRNLRARQRLWRHQVPYFDIVSWVLHLAGLAGLHVVPGKHFPQEDQAPAIAQKITELALRQN